ncbi:centrosomal protein of 44 kDa isoform X2 [Sphaeramia orbicularis]|uniref:centrosomal protein of 44 kDa isoform X2 n=1 Tax=Sphaeramia orbicularis TaxID=375764 RepID=UPI00117EAA75|nr:centrosomal protein of 44 kDa isoform X2 [Sphaeramia orbicularis]
MLSTGDVQGGLRKLETLLRVIKFPGHVDYTGLSKGDPSAFLPIVSYSFTSFSPQFSEQLVAAGLELTGKTDLRFTETVYKILRDIFQYKPILTKQQFLQWGFSQRKISVVCDIINLVLQRHNQLKKPKVRCPVAHKDGRLETHPPLSDPDKALPSMTYVVVNHIENPCTLPTTNSSHKETLPSQLDTYASHMDTHSSDSPEHGITDTTEEEDKADNPHSVEVEERLSALETQLESVFSGLDRLSIMEKRLEELERWRNKDKIEEQVITISRETWENLQSRVLLLETKLELRSTQGQKTFTKEVEEEEFHKCNPPPPCAPSTSSFISSSLSDVSQRDLKDRLDRIANMLKSTSSLLKNTQTTPAACS